MVEQISCGMNNCYLVSGENGAVLVDTATAKFRDRILEKCKAANVRLILLTHGHYDHAQNAAYLSQALGVPVAMHPADIPLLENILAVPLYAHVFSGKAMAAVIRMGQHPKLKKIATRMQKNDIPAFVPDIELFDGFSLAPYGADACVTALPGHTPGSVGVLVGEDFLAGDALMNISSPGRPLHYTDRTAMEASAARIAGLGENITVWFGHGGPEGNRAW